MSEPITPPASAGPSPHAGESGDLFSVFPLRTLRDIFDLPTYEQMETCLDELKECMMQARATNDLMVALVNEKGHDVKKAFEWPEVLEWKDDGKGEVATQYGGPDGKVMMEIFVCGSSSLPFSGFFVVNTCDRPSEEHIAQKRDDGKFYYVHPRLKNVKRYWGMTPENPTPIEAFGLRIALMDGMLYGGADPHLPVTASYSDGRPRKWQGAKSFEFRFQNA